MCCQVGQKEFVFFTVDKCANLKDLETLSVSDPYVKLILKQPDGTNQEFKTSVKDGNLNPEYGESFEFESNAAQWVSGEYEASLSLEASIARTLGLMLAGCRSGMTIQCPTV